MKRVAIEQLAEAAARMREGGRRIVFTNGCFDVLHPGHIYCLCEARAMGDALIVAINSDDSVRRLKGPERPVFSENERAEMLEAMECVDCVVVFSEDTPLRAVEAAMPDVLVKGGDYTEDAVVGRDFVEAHGGRLAIVPPLDGFSSTAMLRAIDAGSPGKP
jgi:rfaE bifunctional protein nucleotidyltransferase chain/domain